MAGEMSIPEPGVYVGVLTTISPQVNITADNISSYFTVSNGSYYFAGSGSTFTTNNAGVNSSTAQTKLTSLQDMALSFDYSYSSESNYDKFTLKVGDTTVENAVSGATTNNRWSGNVTQGTIITFMYTKDGSVNGNDDKCTFSNMAIVDANAEPQTVSVARKVKKGYVGVDGKARKIKKAYVGVGGVARPCWSGGELVYYGEAAPLSVGRYDLAATTVGNYALFGGGAYYSSVVNAYNTSLTRTTPTALSVARAALAATTVGNYALFGGGDSDVYGYSGSSVVNAYNTSLTQTTPTKLSLAREDLAATTVGSYALFGGGVVYDTNMSPQWYNTVDAYNGNLTSSIPTALSTARYTLAATTVGNYALFGGGQSNYKANEVDAYNASLTRTTPTTLSVGRTALAATTVGDYALFGGGATRSSGSYSLSVVDAYDTNLTRTTPIALSTARTDQAATTIGSYALFGGGFNSSISSVVDAYDSNLTRTTLTELSVARYSFAATTVGNYALFGGGITDNDNSKIVDVYTVA